MATVSVDNRPDEVAAAIEEKLHRVRARKVTIGLVRTLLASAAVLLGGMLLAMLIDWLTRPGNDALRPWLTRVPLLATAATMGYLVWRLVNREAKMPLVASDIDHANPELEERWSTLTETNDAWHRGEATHPAVYRQLEKEAVAWAPRVEPRQVITRRTLRRPLWLLAAIFGVLFACMVLDIGQTAVLVRRFLSPHSKITLTKLGGVPASLVVAKGENASLKTELSGRVPESAELVIRRDNGRVSLVQLDVDRGETAVAMHRVVSVEKPFEFQWRAGDAWSDWVPVEIAQRPRLSEVRFKATPPEYTKRKPLVETKLPGSARLVEGTTLEIALKADIELSSMQLDFGPGGNVSLKPDDDGWRRWRTTVTDDFDFAVLLTEPHGLTNRRPPHCRVSVYQDRAPTVKILSPSPDTAVRPDDEVKIHFAAEDDFAVERAELIVYGEENEQGEREILKSIPIDLGEMQGQTSVRGSVSLPLEELQLETGDSISYAVRVHDNRTAPAPDSGVEPLVAESSQPGRDAMGSNSSSSDDSSNASGSENSADDSSPRMASRPDSEAEPSASGPLSDASPSASNGEMNSSLEGEAANAGAADPAGTTAEAEGQMGDPGSPGSGGESADSQPTDPGEATSREADSSQPGAASELGDENGAADSDPASPRESGGTDESNEGSPETENAADQSMASPSGQGDRSDSDSQSSEANPEGNTESSQASPGATGSPNEGSTSNADNQSSGASQSGAANQGQGENESESDNDSQGDADPSEAMDPQAPGENAASEEDSEGDTSATSNEQSLTAQGDQEQQEEAAAEDQSDSANNAKPSDQRDGRVVTPEGSVPLNSDDQTDQQAQNGGGQQQPNPMTRRMLDIPQSSSSGQRQLKIDEYAGSFDGQQRDKVAIAISPILYELDEMLREAEESSDRVAIRLEKGEAWANSDVRTINQVDEKLKRCEKSVETLQTKTNDTPYAFIGLELGHVVEAYVTPARDQLWEALESDQQRVKPIRAAWTDIRSARAKLASLTQTFDRIHREHKLAENAERMKKMYQVYVEDSMALLFSEPDAINDYERRFAEFDLDDEYLARLKEVLEMRNELQAELARMLRDDPRLMRRLVDSLERRSESLRDQMTLLAERQKDLAREVRAWHIVDEGARADLLAAIVNMRQTRVTEIAQEAAMVKERFVAWLPLDLKAEDPAFSEATKCVNAVASSAELLASSSPKDANRIAKGRDLYREVTKLDNALRSVNLGRAHDELDTHLLNRLTETRNLNQLVSSWVRQATLLEDGQYWQEAAIEQYKLAMETDALAGKLSGLEGQLTSGIPASPEIVEQIRTKAKELLTALDTELAASQLAATFALKREQGDQAVQKEQAAAAAFDKCEKMFDELMRLVIDELDKIPPQDPIASLLEDPTLDELMAQLENENDPLDTLGIPQRPTNLRIVQDWMRPGRNGSGGAGRMINAYLRREQDQARRRADRMHQNAVARALKELQKIERAKPKQVAQDEQPVDWNQLLSQLPDELRQGKGEMLPQEYRRMIEQYLTRISRLQGAEPMQAD